jgi:ribosomal protein S27E
MAGRFLKIGCKCGNKQIVFSHTSSIVKCEKCKEPLAHPMGGEAILHGDIEKELG